MAAGLLACAGVHAADKPLIGAAPAWASPSPEPHESPSTRSLPVAMMLNDMQVALDAGGWTEFHHLQAKVQAPEGLQPLGAIPFVWSPWSDTLTFHRAAILRGGQTIDVLPKDGGFTVLRRESQLEQATLTGFLTAVLQPDGLQVGDVLDIEVSIRHADPLLKGHEAALLAGWDAGPIGRTRILARWPATLSVASRQTADLPALKRSQVGGDVVMSLQVDDLAAAVPPAHAPVRFQHGRQVEFSTFRGWDEVSALMPPLFARAAVLAPASPLHAEVARIAAASPDPKLRAAAALDLVESKVRYLAHAEAAGGYTPQSADETWRLRYGDCKAKTALLLALLAALDVPAEAVLANMNGGDAVHDHLPSASVFDHVLVRVRLGGRDYWLDGARQGDGPLDALPTPAYGWVLPIAPSGARLVHISPPPAAAPMLRRVIRYDDSKGVKAPAATHLEDVFGADAGLALHLQLANLTADRLQELMRTYWSGQHTAFTPTHMAADWDAARRELRFSADGTSTLDWSGSGLELSNMELGGEPDLKRDPASSQPDAPYVVDYPSFVETDETVVLPPGDAVPASALRAADLDKTLGGVAYRRSASLDGRTLRVVATTRSLVPEITAADARASVAPLKAMGEDAVYAPAGRWRSTADDAAALATTPTTADAHVARGNALMDAGKMAEAEAEFDAAIDLDPKSQAAWADRAVARAWQGDPRAAADADMADHLGKPEIVAARARALLALRTQGAQASLPAWNRALAIDKTDAFSLTHRVDVEATLHDYDAALRDLDTLERAQPGDASLKLARATIELARGHRAQALALANSARPDTSEGLVQRAELYAQLDAKAAALADLDAALKLQPSAAAYLARARLRGADTAEGKADLAAAGALDPQDFDVQLQRINAFTHKGEDAAALPLLDKLIKAHPEIGSLRVGRAQILQKLGRRTDALAEFTAIRALKGENASPASVLCSGEAGAHGEPSAILEDCTRAMREDPHEPRYVMDRALAAHRLGLDAQAAADIASVRSLAGEDAGRLNNACYALAGADFELPLALSLCDAALKVSPASGNIIDSRAFTLLRMDRNSEALAAYDAALKIKPKLAAALYGRALVEKRLGRAAASTADRQAALALNPNLTTVFADMGVAFPN